MATPNNMWSAPSPHPHHHQAAQPIEGDDLAMQVRPMGLKVLYTFDRDGQVSCLARWPHILQIQTLPVDERTTIGVVDLRTCLQAIAQCSPEIVNQQENDYTVYAVDYSEPDTPLVGQGMLSWGLEFASDHNSPRHQQQQLVTGRVTRSLLPVFSNGSRETLEVKMKLTAVAKMQRLGFPSMDNNLNNVLRSDPIQPTDITTSEWASFMQSNPGLGSSTNMASMSTAPLNVNLGGDSRYMDIRSDPPPQPTRPASIPPNGSRPQNDGPMATNNNNNNMPPMQPVPPRPAPSGDSASSPAPSQSVEIPVNQSARPTSRPSSRASRTRAPTGRPRGRPRKKPLEAGNTSAAEEATDGDEGPQKKRAKVISADFTSSAPFGSAPESLRVAASTSGSLRNMRPVGAGGNASLGNHVQDVPRAPTPVPDGSMLQRQQRRLLFENKMKPDFAGDAESSMYHARFNQQTMQRSMSHDARSPTDSIGQSPDQGYVPEDSPADIGSSPPVPRTSAYMHSSPYVSSPVLPPMPVPIPQVDSGFMSGGFDDIFDEDELLQDAPQDHGQELPGQPQDRMMISPPVQQFSKPHSRKGSRAHRQGLNFPFQEVNPGPKELLPTKSIFNPAGKTKALNRVAHATSVPPMPKKNTDRSFKRSNTAPNPSMSDPDPLLRQPNDQQDGEAPQEGNAPQTSQTAMQSLESQQQPAFNHQQQLSAQNMGNTSAQSQPAVPVTTGMPIPERPEPVSSKAAQPASKPTSNNSAPAVPASDPVVDSTGTSSRAAQSEAPTRAHAPPPREPSPTEEPPRYNKNMVKKQSIKEKLEEAIQRGESPPFCNNCGAIETPTWRKIWTQDHRGVPGPYEFSDKPGFVTTIDVLEKDAEGQISMYQLVKKNLGPTDDKKLWKETLLCNPCGIWLAKFKVHRPPDRWDKDAARLNQPRKKKASRNKKRKNDTQPNPTSEAYFTTDPIGPADTESPEEAQHQVMTQQTHQNVTAMEDSNNDQPLHHMILNSRSSPKRRGLGSTHSRDSGTADSPIAVEDDLGTTRRLLFPSPKKEGAPKVLGELAGNAVNANNASQDLKPTAMGKENIGYPTEFQPPRRPNTPILPGQDELDQELFGSPVMRPSTPPTKNNSSGIFKTPTRPTPNHRPITRSISRSIRTVRSAQRLPGQQLFTQSHRTPTKTPRGTRTVSGNNGSLLVVSASKRRSPRHARFALDDSLHVPLTSSPATHDFEAWGSLNQLLSEADQFTANSSSHGLLDVNMQHYDSDSVQQLVEGAGALDFGSFMGTDMVMPSSPPGMMRGHHHGHGDGGGNGNLSFEEASLSIESLWVETTLATSGAREGRGQGSVVERNAAADVDELS